MKKTIVVLDGGYASYHFEKKYFADQGYLLEFFNGDRQDLEGRTHAAQDADGMLVRWTVVDEALLKRLPRLKAIVRYGTGYDNLDLEAIAQRNIRAANVQSYANDAVSDHALTMMMACIRLLPLGISQFSQKFARPPDSDVRELKDLTIGIIGLGRIGGTFCTKIRGLVKKVMAVDPYIPKNRFGILGAQACQLDRLFKDADVISLHCNLTHETTYILNDVAFETMKKRPVIVNTSRGPVLDHSALFDALSENKIHSAGLDVFPEEPPGEDLKPLLSHPRVIATGHYAWYSENSAVELQKRAARNMIGLLHGNPVEDEIFPSTLNK